MANLTGLTTNFFPTASETYANNLSSSISALAATVPVNSANEYTDGDVATITVDAGTSAEATFTGVKASTPARFINCIWTEGNLGVGHASGATVIDYDSATHMSQVSKGILKEHKQSGQHSNINADSIQVNGSIIATGDLTEAGVTARTFRTETTNDFVASGGVWTIAAGLNGAMTALTAYITGYRSTVNAVASRAFTASKDTYVDILRTTVGAVTTFTLVYTEVANGAASPALAANSLRLAKVVTSGVAITSVSQGSVDSLNNQIYPQSPNGNNAWLSYTPTLTGISSSSNIGRYIKQGKTCTAMANILFSGAGSGTYTVSLPFTVAPGSQVYIGQLWGLDSGTSYYVGTATTIPGTNTVNFTSNSTGNLWGAAIPFTWAVNDIIRFQITYETV